MAEKGDLVFVFNFHPTNSYQDYRIGTKHAGPYKVLPSDGAHLWWILSGALATCCTLLILLHSIYLWQQEPDMQVMRGCRSPCHQMRRSLAATRTSARSTTWRTRHRCSLHSRDSLCLHSSVGTCVSQSIACLSLHGSLVQAHPSTFALCSAHLQQMPLCKAGIRPHSMDRACGRSMQHRLPTKPEPPPTSPWPNHAAVPEVINAWAHHRIQDEDSNAPPSAWADVHAVHRRAPTMAGHTASWSTPPPAQWPCTRQQPPVTHMQTRARWAFPGWASRTGGPSSSAEPSSSAGSQAQFCRSACQPGRQLGPRAQ